MTVYAPTWLDPADVAGWLRVNNQPPDDPELDRVCAQTEAYVQRCRPDQWDDTDPEAPVYTPDAETYQGAVMYAARQSRRRNSPVGSEPVFDGTATFVAKYDADIARALRTDSWTVPGFG